MKTADYIRLLREKHSTPDKVATDYRLAKVLRISTQVMANYSSGKRIPGPVVAFRIAEQLGEQPVAVVADFEAERAERDGAPEDADYLRERVATLRRVLGVVATSILLTMGMGTFSNADARLALDSHGAENKHRIKRRRNKGGTRGRRAGPWDGLGARLQALRQALTELTSPAHGMLALPMPA